MNKRKIEQLKKTIKCIEELKEIIDCKDEREYSGKWSCYLCGFASNIKVKNGYEDFATANCDIPLWAFECNCELDKFVNLLLDEYYEEGGLNLDE